MSQRPDPDTAVGTSVHVDYRKWVDARTDRRAEHWQEPCQFLGIDQYGTWLGMPPGTVAAKPTHRMVHRWPHAKLVTDAGWSANIGNPDDTDPHRIRIYVDMVWFPEWTREDDGFRVTMVDLDLDVFQRIDGAIEIDDEDEFAEHRVSGHYPRTATDLATRACAEVHRMLTDRAEPFATVADRWLAAVPSGPA